MVYLRELLKTGGSQLGAFYQFNDTPYVDTSDQLNWQVTVNLLIVLVLVLVNIRRFLNKIISCAVPIYFSDNQEQYANEICYVAESKYAANESSTILIAPNQTLVYFKKSLDQRLDADEPRQLGSYYVWVPYVLMLLIFVFLFIKCLWLYVLSYQFTELDLNELLKAAARLKDFPLDEFVHVDETSQRIDINQHLFRNSNAKYLFSSVNKVVRTNLEVERDDSSTACKSYMSIKIINIVVAIAQTFLINQLLGIDIYSFGCRKFVSYVYFLVKHIFHSSDHKLDENVKSEDDNDENAYYHINSPYFPLKSVCVFRIRELASTNSYAVVCSLPINLFIQFAFFILSVWYLVLIGINVAYAVKWWLRFKHRNQSAYIRSMLTHRLGHIRRRRQHDKLSRSTKTGCFALVHLDDDNDDDDDIHQAAQKVPTVATSCRRCEFLFNMFFDSFLTSDLVFFLRIVSVGSSQRLVESLLVYFWKIFVDSIHVKCGDDDDDDDDEEKNGGNKRVS